MLAATMGVNISGFSANAAGAINCSFSSNTASYTYFVDGNLISATNETQHYGKGAALHITVPTSGSYNITFNGAANSAATVYFYKVTAGVVSNNYSAYVNIPKSVSGMPTLYSSVQLTSGEYI